MSRPSLVIGVYKLFSTNNVGDNVNHSQQETRKKKIIDGQYLNLVSLLQLSDSFFPTGMYTMSNGLESFFYSKKLKNADQLLILVKNYLENQTGPLDCSALGVSYMAAQTSDLQGIINIDQTVFAMRLIEEVRNAAARSGTQLLKCLRSFLENDNTDSSRLLERYHESIKEGKSSGVYPVALAVASHRLGIPKFNAGVMMLYSFTVSMAGAALRLGILDHIQGQRIIHELRHIIVRTVENNIDRPLTSFWQFAPEIDILQMQHEKMSSKMFIT
jgi:urease accessory protein